MNLRLEDLRIEGTAILREMLELGGFGAVVYGPDRRVRWAAGPLPGLDAEHAQGLTCSDVHAACDTACEPCFLHAAAEHGHETQTVKVRDPAPGSPRIFQVAVAPLTGPSGEPGGWVELLRAVGEPQGYETLQDASAADILRLIGAWSIAVVALDRDSRIVSWNTGASKLYGRTDREMLGRRWPEAVDETEVVDLPHAAGTRTRRYEARHLTGWESALHVMVTRTDFVGATGEPSGAFALVLDLTESKALERRLARRVGELSVIREIAETLQSAMGLHKILRTILVGATAGQGLRFNRAFLLLVDGKRNELRGRDAIGPADPDEAHRIWSELDSRQRSLKDLLRAFEPLIDRPGRIVHTIADKLSTKLDDADSLLIRTLKAGSTARVENGVDIVSARPADERILGVLGVRSFVAVPLVAEGKPVGLLVADNAITARPIQDEDVMVLELLGIQAALAIERARVTEALATQVATLEQVTRELRTNEERLVRAERLSAIGEVAARVVHEIRNPLAAIGGFARSLLRGDEPPASKHEALEIIVDEVRRLETIVREVLDFSKPQPPRIGDVDLVRLAQEALDLLRWELDEAGVVGAVAAEGAVPPAAADRDQIFQALVNILRNSLHAMPDGGALTVRIRASGHAVKIAVEDTGVGMPPDVKARVFEPFYTTKPSGSGLGLTIAAQIVRDHGGEIQVESKEGVGTAVTLRLPATDAEEDSDGEDPDRRG